MSISNEAAKAIKDRIGFLEDNAYRYRHIGRSTQDIATAERQEAEAKSLRDELAMLLEPKP